MTSECCQRLRFARTRCPRCRASPLTEHLDHGSGWGFSWGKGGWKETLGCSHDPRESWDASLSLSILLMEIAMSWAWHNVHGLRGTADSGLHTVTALCIVSISFEHKQSERRDGGNRKDVPSVSRQIRTRTLASLLPGLWLDRLGNLAITSAAVPTMSPSGSGESKHHFLSSPRSRLPREENRDRLMLEWRVTGNRKGWEISDATV